MGFGVKKCVLKAKSGRGAADADAVFSALEDNWDTFSGPLASLSDENKQALAALIDPIAEDSDPTPFEMLTGNLDNF